MNATLDEHNQSPERHMLKKISNPAGLTGTHAILIPHQKPPLELPSLTARVYVGLYVIELYINYL